MGCGQIAGFTRGGDPTFRPDEDGRPKLIMYPTWFRALSRALSENT